MSNKSIFNNLQTSTNISINQETDSLQPASEFSRLVNKTDLVDYASQSNSFTNTKNEDGQCGIEKCSISIEKSQQQENIDFNDQVESESIEMKATVVELDFSSIDEIVLSSSGEFNSVTNQLTDVFSTKIVQNNDKLFYFKYNDSKQSEESIGIAHEYGYLIRVQNSDQLFPLQYYLKQQPFITFKRIRNMQSDRFLRWTPVSLNSISESIQLKDSQYNNDKYNKNEEWEYKSVPFVGTCAKDFIHVQWGENIKKLLFVTAPYIYIRFHNYVKVFNTNSVAAINDFGENVDLCDCIALLEMILFEREMSLNKLAKYLFSHLFVGLPYSNFKQKAQWKKIVHQFLMSQHIFVRSLSAQNEGKQIERWSCRNNHL